MTEEKQKFYLMGKLFDTFEEMNAYALNFPHMPYDFEFFKQFFCDRLREMEMNISINPEFTNRQAMRLIRLNTEGIAGRSDEYNGVEKCPACSQ